MNHEAKRRLILVDIDDNLLNRRADDLLLEHYRTEETQLVYRSVKPATLNVDAQNQEIASMADAQVIGGEFRTELSGSAIQ